MTLRDDIIALLREFDVGCPYEGNGHVRIEREDDAPQIADAILACLDRWTALEPDDSKAINAGEFQ